MKKTIVSLMIWFVMVQSAHASDYDDLSDKIRPDGFYLGGFGGTDLLTKFNSKFLFDPQIGYTSATAIGYRWHNQFRFELEYAYRSSNAKLQRVFGRNGNSHIWTHSYLVNSLWDVPFRNEWNLRPFIGGGIGFCQQQELISYPQSYIMGKFAHKAKSNGLAWQIIAGIAYPICDSIDVSAEYRLFKGPFVIYNQSIGMGLKYHF